VGLALCLKEQGDGQLLIEGQRIGPPEVIERSVELFAAVIGQGAFQTGRKQLAIRRVH
jgi:hypothetical protein